MMVARAGSYNGILCYVSRHCWRLTFHLSQGFSKEFSRLLYGFSYDGFENLMLYEWRDHSTSSGQIPITGGPQKWWWDARFKAAKSLIKQICIVVHSKQDSAVTPYMEDSNISALFHILKSATVCLAYTASSDVLLKRWRSNESSHHFVINAHSHLWIWNVSVARKMISLSVWKGI